MRRRNRRRVLILALALAGAWAEPCLSEDRFVDAAACVAPGTGTLEDPYCAIQDAICELSDSGGGVVRVFPGFYPEAVRIVPGIRVVSLGGASVTTIDATDRACIDNACQPSGSPRCAAVIFDAGTGPGDRLVGFRVTGGEGLRRPFADGSPDVAAGGGIFVFGGSPTISENIIAGNGLDRATSRKLGGGIYVNGETGGAPVQPIITSNIIEDNEAIDALIPQTGNSQVAGGGIYVGPGASPLIENNIIRNNRVQNAQIMSGGGLIVYSTSTSPAPTITRNRISGNFSGRFGGGVSFAYALDGPTLLPSTGLFENNLVQRNTADEGGGIAAGSTQVVIRNNTVIENSAFIGGGVRLLPTAQPGTEAELVNNLIVLNTGVTVGGLAASPGTPDLRFNDLWGNLPIETDLVGVIGSSGNLSVDPQFFDLGLDEAERDLHLQTASPVLDGGEAAGASALDLDGDPRIQGAGIDLGAFETGDSDGDGVLNHLDNCPVDANADQLDTDDDSLGDACDTNEDGDNDGVDDALDSDPENIFVCSDTDEDGCDDCINGGFQPENDGTDTDGDGLCDAGDPDDDADEVLDGQDTDPLDPFVCGDSEPDSCDDCGVTGRSTPDNDGQDTDGDGLCDDGDEDIDSDGDGADDELDSDDANPFVCRDRDGDNCDDCSNGQFDPADDGPDTDGDGACNAFDLDDDDDGTDDVADCEPLKRGLAGAPSVVSFVRLAGTEEAQIGWLPGSQGHTFNVYRGDLTPGQPWTDQLACLIAESPERLVVDSAIPAPNHGFYYLITSVNGCGESGVGTRSDGTLRPLTAACPALFADTDADGVLDNDDNCPLINEPLQLDADRDFVGGACDNCPSRTNFDQRDSDGDGVGNACDFLPS